MTLFINLGEINYQSASMSGSGLLPTSSGSDEAPAASSAAAASGSNAPVVNPGVQALRKTFIDEVWKKVAELYLRRQSQLFLYLPPASSMPDPGIALLQYCMCLMLAIGYEDCRKLTVDLFESGVQVGKDFPVIFWRIAAIISQLLMESEQDRINQFAIILGTTILETLQDGASNAKFQEIIVYSYKYVEDSDDVAVTFPRGSKTVTHHEMQSLVSNALKRSGQMLADEEDEGNDENTKALFNIENVIVENLVAFVKERVDSWQEVAVEANQQLIQRDRQLETLADDTTRLANQFATAQEAAVFNMRDLSAALTSLSNRNRANDVQVRQYQARMAATLNKVKGWKDAIQQRLADVVPQPQVGNQNPAVAEANTRATEAIAKAKLAMEQLRLRMQQLAPPQ